MKYSLANSQVWWSKEDLESNNEQKNIETKINGIL